jgi:Helicase associated domain
MLSLQRSLSIVVLSLHIGSVVAFRPTSSCRYRNRLKFEPYLETAVFRYSRGHYTLYNTVNDKSLTTTTDTGLLDKNANPLLNATLPKIASPVLSQLYPELLEYQKQYGHANIPLGSEAGRKCSTLRRLRVQEKLVNSDIELLDSLQFTWHSFEDVYIQQKEHFDDFILRLKEYSAAHDGDLSPPKKYPADPELGAWVTAVRRLYGTGKVDATHMQVLDQLGFQWNSPRKCGSTFMQQYRSIQERLKSGEETSDILSDPSIAAWIQAQQQANLSETRKHYMTEIFGNDWTSFGT